MKLNTKVMIIAGAIYYFTGLFFGMALAQSRGGGSLGMGDLSYLFTSIVQILKLFVLFMPALILGYYTTKMLKDNPEYQAVAWISLAWIALAYVMNK